MSIEEIFNKVADELPHGYTIRISLENGYGEAVLERNGEFFYRGSSDDSMENSVLDCLSFAKFDAEII